VAALEPAAVDLDLDAVSPGSPSWLPARFQTPRWRKLPVKLAIELDRRDARRRPLGRAAPAHATTRPARARRTRRVARRGPPRPDDPREPRPPDGAARGVYPEYAVLRAIVPGNTACLALNPNQRAALADQEGLNALSVLGHVVWARAATGLREELPLTEGFVGRVARRLGLDMRRAQLRRVVPRLAAGGVISSAGSYRQA